MLEYFVTSPLGIEEIVATELRELGVSNLEVDVGKVFFRTDDLFIYTGNFTLRTINRLFILLLRSKFKDLDDIGKLASSISYSEFIPPNVSFAVRAERVGKHDFTSIDVKKVVGAAVIKSYMEERGLRLRVDLDNPDVEVFALVRNDELVIGINTTGTSLHRRGYRVYNHPAALKTTLAAALAILTGISRGCDEAFLDPMCGGGTVAIEAVHRMRNYPITLFRYDYAFRRLGIYDRYEEERVIDKLMSGVKVTSSPAVCIDVSEKHLSGAEINALSGRVRDVMKFIVGDSTKAGTYGTVKEMCGSIKYVALNPPYGMRFHNPKKLPGFYREFLRVLSNELPGARVALITAAIKAMEGAISDVGVKVVKKLNVMHGGLPARMYLIRT